MTPNTGPNAATVAALLERAATHDRKHAAALESGGYTSGRPFFDDVRITHADAARALRAAADLLLCHDETGHDLCAWPVVAEFVSGLSGVDVEPVQTPEARPAAIDPMPPATNRDNAIEAGAMAGYAASGGEARFQQYWRNIAAAVIDAAAPHLTPEPIGYVVVNSDGEWIFRGARDAARAVARGSLGKARAVALIPMDEEGQP